MKVKMTHAARADLTESVRSRYAGASGKTKRRILDEFIAATGYHEKSAIRALNAVPAAKVRKTRNRPSLYDEAARAALIVLWEASDRVCGKRLKALLPILLPALERNGHLKLNDDLRAVDERIDDRSLVAHAEKRAAPQEAGQGSAGTSPPHQTANLCLLE